MPTNLVVNGVGYAYPNTSDQTWGAAATNWAIAVTNSCLQLSGGLFTLTADVDFGATYGILANYWKSRSADIAQSGLFRCAVGDTISFRNNANSADLPLGVNGSDQLTFNSTAFLLSPMTTLGDTIYGGASGTSTRLAGNTTSTKKYLSQTGTGSVSAAPAWAQVAFADLSGSVAGSQLPTFTGDVTNSSAAMTVAKIAGVAVGTPTGTGNVVFSASPTLTGTLTAAAIATSSFVAPTVQKFTSSSGTYTTPTSPRSPVYIRVRVVGGGGGGGGSGTGSPGAGATGNTSSFGTSLISATGGGGAALASGAAGGTASLGSGPVGIALSGGAGSGTNTLGAGGAGGNSAFGGGGGGGQDGNAGNGGAANTGGGGGGAGATSNAGAGGGAGGFIDAIITAPSATYAYVVGAASAGGSAGTGGAGGGNGGSGLVIVEEFYQ